MPEPLLLLLTSDQRTCLEQARDHHPKPYIRERAAVLLKIADGRSGNWASRHGGLRPHDGDTISRWVHRYQSEGIAGLSIHPGRGRKPSFSPSLSK